MQNNLTRKSNFELLRIVAMFLIVLHHLVYHGVMQNTKGASYSSLWHSGSDMNQLFTCIFFPGGEVGIALFFMISGFFLIKSDSIKLKKVVLQTLFYSVFTVLVFFSISLLVHFYNFDNPYNYIDSKTLSKNIIFNLFAPLRSGQFWFVSAYILLILVKPLYNNFLNKLNKKGFIAFLAVLFIFGLLFSRYFNLVLGYTQAAFYYALGACYKTFLSDKKKTISRGGRLFVFAIIMWILYAFIRYERQIMTLNGFEGELCKTLMSLIPSCVCVALISIALFKLFANLNIGYNKIINTIAATTFGIYLLHEGFFTRPVLWDKVVGVYPNLYESPYYPIIVPFAALAVFVGCSLFELFRGRVFKPVENKIDILLNKASKKFFIEGNNG